MGARRERPDDHTVASDLASKRHDGISQDVAVCGQILAPDD
jgi:hypothetical protein